ncbi:MAG TPA: MarR family transcriptional regulator [Acidimicrobiia bacterium]|nr:MarR family transcriptional regulator [Acidimicrobiia bacterium]
MSQVSNPVQPRTSYLVARLDRLIRQRLSEALKPFDISVPQYTLMSVLDHRPGLSNAQLARRSYITAQAMHQVVNTLEQRDLISRSSSPDHGRVQMAELTDSGRDLLEKCDGVVGEVEADLFGPLGPDEESLLRRLLQDTIDQGSRA